MEIDDEDINEEVLIEAQDPARVGEVPANNQQNNEEETLLSAQATHHSQSIEESIVTSDWDNQRTNEEEETPSSVQSTQDPAEVPRNNQQNNEEGTRISVEATQHSPSIGEASGESRVSISERDLWQSNEEEGSVGPMMLNGGIKMRYHQETTRSQCKTVGCKVMQRKA